MAKAFFDKNTNEIYKICEDSDLNLLNLDASFYTEKDLTDAQFLDAKRSLKFPTLSDGNLVMQDLAFGGIKDAERFTKNISSKIKIMDDFLNNNEGHSWHAGVTAYKEALLAIDTSTITFPYEKTLEQYCEDNSKTYYHPLQIP